MYIHLNELMDPRLGLKVFNKHPYIIFMYSIKDVLYLIDCIQS